MCTLWNIFLGKGEDCTIDWSISNVIYFSHLLVRFLSLIKRCIFLNNTRAYACSRTLRILHSMLLYISGNRLKCSSRSQLFNLYIYILLFRNKSHYRYHSAHNRNIFRDISLNKQRVGKRFKMSGGLMKTYADSWWTVQEELGYLAWKYRVRSRRPCMKISS
jgi:hypothetical protein